MPTHTGATPYLEIVFFPKRSLRMRYLARLLPARFVRPEYGVVISTLFVQRQETHWWAPTHAHARTHAHTHNTHNTHTHTPHTYTTHIHHTHTPHTTHTHLFSILHAMLNIILYNIQDMYNSSLLNCEETYSNLFSLCMNGLGDCCTTGRSPLNHLSPLIHHCEGVPFNHCDSGQWRMIYQFTLQLRVEKRWIVQFHHTKRASLKNVEIVDSRKLHLELVYGHWTKVSSMDCHCHQ